VWAVRDHLRSPKIRIPIIDAKMPMLTPEEESSLLQERENEKLAAAAAILAKVKEEEDDDDDDDDDEFNNDRDSLNNFSFKNSNSTNNTIDFVSGRISPALSALLSPTPLVNLQTNAPSPSSPSSRRTPSPGGGGGGRRPSDGSNHSDNNNGGGSLIGGSGSTTRRSSGTARFFRYLSGSNSTSDLNNNSSIVGAPTKRIWKRDSSFSSGPGAPRKPVLLDDELGGGGAGSHSSHSQHTGLQRTYKYLFAPMNLIDAIAIIPFYVGLAMGGGSGLAVLRILRLARVFRIFKVGKYNEGVTMLSNTLKKSLPALQLMGFFSTIAIVVKFCVCVFVCIICLTQQQQ
jgi:hypothetical protein